MTLLRHHTELIFRALERLIIYIVLQHLIIILHIYQVLIRHLLLMLKHLHYIQIWHLFIDRRNIGPKLTEQLTLLYFILIQCINNLFNKIVAIKYQLSLTILDHLNLFLVLPLLPLNCFIKLRIRWLFCLIQFIQLPHGLYLLSLKIYLEVLCSDKNSTTV